MLLHSYVSVSVAAFSVVFTRVIVAFAYNVSAGGFDCECCVVNAIYICSYCGQHVCLCINTGYHGIEAAGSTSASGTTKNRFWGIGYGEVRETF
jgi:hypothetical protein